MVKNPKWSSLSVFLALWDLHRNLFSTKGSPFFKMFCNSGCTKMRNGPLQAPGAPVRSFYCFSWIWYSFCEFDTLSSLRLSCFFCYFWVLDMAKTWAVPGWLRIIIKIELPGLSKTVSMKISLLTIKKASVENINIKSDKMKKETFWWNKVC